MCPFENSAWSAPRKKDFINITGGGNPCLLMARWSCGHRKEIKEYYIRLEVFTTFSILKSVVLSTTCLSGDLPKKFPGPDKPRRFI
jgi:hypothetical protein